LQKPQVLHLAQLDFLHAHENVVLLGPPGTGKTHCEYAVGGPGRSLPGCTGGPGMTPKSHWPLATGPHRPVVRGALALDMSAGVGGAGLASAHVA